MFRKIFSIMNKAKLKEPLQILLDEIANNKINLSH